MVEQARSKRLVMVALALLGGGAGLSTITCDSDSDVVQATPDGAALTSSDRDPLFVSTESRLERGRQTSGTTPSVTRSFGVTCSSCIGQSRARATAA